MGGGGLIRAEAYFIFSLKKRGLLERGAYLRRGLNSEITVFKLKTFSDLKIFIKIRAFGYQTIAFDGQITNRFLVK